MADEARVQFSLTIRTGNLSETIQESFTFDVAGVNGPYPGSVIATVDGTEVDLSGLTTPGACVIKNLDETNFVEVGIWEPATSKLYPFLEIGPGESTVFKFSRNILEEYEGTGTGTSAPTNQVRIKANTASCKVQVKAYEA